MSQPEPAVSQHSMSYITEGPVSAAVRRLAWPVVLSEALHTLFHIVDIAWVGPLGAWATAAISSSMFALWAVFSLGNLVSVGLTAQVSRAIGAGDRPAAARATAHAYLFSAGLGILVAIVCALTAPHLFQWIGVAPDVGKAGALYLTLYAAGAPISFLYTTSAASMRAAGDTRTPLLVTATALVANAGLAPFLIYGWGPFPQCGVAGAAIATVICQAGAAVTFLVIAFRGHRALPFDARSLRHPDLSIIFAQAKIGIPYCLVGLLFSLNYLAFSTIAARISTAAIAVIGIGNRLESVTYLGADGFGVAAATLVGQNLGAGRPERAESGAWISVRSMTVLSLVMTVLMLAIPRELFSVFTNDPAVLDLCATYARILAVCQLATGIEGVLSGAFAGAGNTVPPMTIHVVFGVLRPILAVVLAIHFGMGMAGIALTISGSCILRAFLLASIFRKGRWKSHRPPVGGPLPISPIPSEDAPDLAN